MRPLQTGFCGKSLESPPSFVELKKHEKEVKVLDDRLSRSRTVSGTQRVHFFIPISANVEVKLFSSSIVSRRKKVGVGSAPVLSPQATAS